MAPLGRRLTMLERAELRARQRHIGLPLSIARVVPGRGLRVAQALTIARQRARTGALRHPHIADHVVPDGKIALPLRNVRITRSKDDGDREALAIAHEHIRTVALLDQ